MPRKKISKYLLSDKVSVIDEDDDIDYAGIVKEIGTTRSKISGKVVDKSNHILISFPQLTPEVEGWYLTTDSNISLISTRAFNKLEKQNTQNQSTKQKKQKKQQNKKATKAKTIAKQNKQNKQNNQNKQNTRIKAKKTGKKNLKKTDIEKKKQKKKPKTERKTNQEEEKDLEIEMAALSSCDAAICANCQMVMPTASSYHRCQVCLVTLHSKIVCPKGEWIEHDDTGRYWCRTHRPQSTTGIILFTVNICYFIILYTGPPKPKPQPESERDPLQLPGICTYIYIYKYIYIYICIGIEPPHRTFIASVMGLEDLSLEDLQKRAQMQLTLNKGIYIHIYIHIYTYIYIYIYIYIHIHKIYCVASHI